MPFEVMERDMKLPLDWGKIITIPGVRRCGKSTMMELAINALLNEGVNKDRILWIGFDDERLRSMTIDEFDEIITAYMEMYPDIDVREVYMFFDEIQLIDSWELFVLRVYKSYCKNIYVCGSNATMLSKELKTALRGYPLEYDAYPLSFNEYCRFTDINTSFFLEQDRARLRMAFERYVCGSAFPEIVLTKSRMEQLQLLHGYFDTMLLRDLVEHYNISNMVALRYFVKRVMANVTKPTSINSIYNDLRSNSVKVNKDDLYKWIDYACDIFLFVRIHRYTRSLKKGLAYSDKYYPIDNGLRNSVLMPQSDELGKNLETVVMLELQRRLLPSEKITYYQGAAECDFMVQQDETVKQLIQVAWAMNDKDARRREVSGLLEAARETGCTRLLIVTSDEESTLNESGFTICVVPAWKWCLGRD